MVSILPNEQAFATLLRSLPDAMLLLRRDGVVLAASARAEQLFDHPPHGLDGVAVASLLSYEGREGAVAPWTSYFETGGSATDIGGVTGRRRDGTEFPARINLNLLSLGGAPGGEKNEMWVLISVRDSSARQRVEDRFRRLLESAPDAMVIADRQGCIAVVNAQAEALFGYARAELLGQPVEILIPERYRGAHPGHRDRYFSQPRTRPMGAGGLALFGRRKDGTEFPAEISLSPLEGEDDMMAITAIRDASERKKDEEARAKLYQTQEALRMRDEFLSVASHELKTPLTALQMQSDTLLRAFRKGRYDSERVIAKAESINRAAQRLNTLINQLLDLSRISGGRLTLARERVDLAAVVKGVADLFHDELDRAGCELRLHLPRQGSGLFGLWDPLRIEQVVTNLLSNALKYGQGRPIEISVGPGGEGLACLRVRDHGIGIAPEHQARIFERFERILSSRNYGGFGLGLWISRQIIEAHGGGIQVWSQPGAGSTFTVELPRGELSAEASGPSSSAGPCVMLVEDDALVRSSLKEALEDEGVTVLTADNGLVALEILRTGARPCVILLDLMMPVMDAWMFRAEQQRDPILASIPVVVLSAADHLEQRASTLGELAGCLKKPLDLETLLLMVRRHCIAGSSSGLSPERSISQPAPA